VFGLESVKGRRLKGFEMGPNTVFFTFLALVICMFIFAVFINLGGVLSALDQALAKLFGEEIVSEETNYQIAKTSVNALICAINSVTIGSKWSGPECSAFYAGSSTTSPYSIPWSTTSNVISKDYSDFMTGLATAAAQGSGPNMTSVDCKTVVTKKETVDATAHRFAHTNIKYTPDNIPNKDRYFECISYGIDSKGKWTTGSTVAGEYGLECYTCGDDTRIGNTRTCEHIISSDYVCEVDDFHLPQNTDYADEWLAAYGDPKYLVYWQAFPPGENSDWNKEETSWYSQIGTSIFGLSCIAGGVAGGIITAVKGAKAVVKPTWILDGLSRFRSSRAVSKMVATGIDTGRVADGVVDSLRTLDQQGIIKLNVIGPKILEYLKGGKTAFSKAAKKAVFPELEKYLASKGIAETSHNAFKSWAVKTGIGTAAVSTLTGVAANIQADRSAYTQARLESEFGKFFPADVPNSIQLQNSMIERIPYELEDNVIPRDSVITDPTSQNIVDLKRPVILDKTGVIKLGDVITEFYLVSPCFADLEVSKQEVKCGLFAYDKTSGEIKCVSPDDSSGVWGGIQSRLLGWKPCGALLSADYPSKKYIDNEYDFITKMGSTDVFKADVQIEVEDSTGNRQTITRDMVYDPIFKTRFYFDRQNEVFDHIQEDGESPQEIKYVSCSIPDTTEEIEELSVLKGYHRCDLEMGLPPSERNYHFYAEDENGDMGQFLAFRIGPNFGSGGPREIAFIIKDSYPDGSPDGKADQIENYYVQDVRIMQHRVFSDWDGNGEIDSVVGDQCTAEAISVKPTKDTPQGEDNNYCFKKDYSGYIDFAATTAAIGISVGVKALGVTGLPGLAVSTATDCTLAVATAVFEPGWPS
jgi:hypothetical protein